MICINREPTLTNEHGKALCVIQADTTPAEMPLNGMTVIDLDDHTAIAPGSILFVVSTGKRYIMNESGTAWNEFGAGE